MQERVFTKRPFENHLLSHSGKKLHMWNVQLKIFTEIWSKEASPDTNMLRASRFLCNKSNINSFQKGFVNILKINAMKCKKFVTIASGVPLMGGKSKNEFQTITLWLTLLLFLGTCAYTFSPEERSCYIFSTRNSASFLNLMFLVCNAFNNPHVSEFYSKHFSQKNMWQIII